MTFTIWHIGFVAIVSVGIGFAICLSIVQREARKREHRASNDEPLGI